MGIFSIGALLGNLEGVHLSGLLRKKKMYIWVPFLDLEDITFLSPGAIWNFNKGTGSPELILDYGAQRTRL
jgi:hypothetical protein